VSSALYTGQFIQGEGEKKFTVIILAWTDVVTGGTDKQEHPREILEAGSRVMKEGTVALTSHLASGVAPGLYYVQQMIKAAIRNERTYLTTATAGTVTVIIGTPR